MSAKDLWQVAPASPLAQELEEIARRIAAMSTASVPVDAGFIARLRFVFDCSTLIGARIMRTRS